MKEIIVKNTGNSLTGQLVSLYNTFRDIKEREKISFNLTELKWVNPLLILPISSYCEENKCRYILPCDEVKSYLNTIHFPAGVDSVSKFQKLKSFIPITVLRKNTDPEKRELLASCFEEMVHRKVDPGAKAANAIIWPITELIANIFEHSRKNEGWALAQWYPKKEYMDLCVLDRGRGLANSYRQEKELNYSDARAIKEAMTGHSTKPGVDRGYGLRKSKEVICDGLGGSFILISGSVAFISEGNAQKLVSLPKFYWQGVIVAYRIPKPAKGVDIYSYVE